MKDDDIVSSAWKHAAVLYRTERRVATTFEDKVKHTVGFSYNEVSRRYVDDTPEFFVPDEWRARPEKNKKQGSGDVLTLEDVERNSSTDPSGSKWILSAAERVAEDCLEAYNDLLKAGVCPEQARMVLPQSMYTSYYVTGSLSAWARAYNLRIDSHAQKEIQDLAKQWHEIIQPLCPVSWEALTS